MTAPPDALVRTLVEGPSPVVSFEWHEAIGSTNRRAGELAAAGAPEIAVVAADRQTAGRGRLGRRWAAPPGTSLLCSLLLRPPVDPASLPLLSLLTGLVLAETVERFLPAGEAALKWPNDLLVRASGDAPWRKAAGILVEASGEAAVVGLGCNVDWRGHERPAELREAATSLAEVAGAPVNRWRVLAAVLGVYGNRYREWCGEPGAFLDAYRARCVTLGQRIRAERPGAGPLEGTAEAIAPSGALLVRTPGGGLVEVAAADVRGVRPR